MSKNLLYETAHLLVDQMKKVTSARGSELDREATRLDSISRGAEALSELADKQIKVLYATGFLPDANILVDNDEAKLVNAKRNLLNPKQNKGLLMSEFDS